MCELSTARTTLWRLLTTISGLSEEIKDRMVELQIGQRNERRQKIHRWLSSLDPSSNHNDACKKRQPTTGAWFVGSDQFAEWKFSSNSFLWLHGIRKYAFYRRVVQICWLLIEYHSWVRQNCFMASIFELRALL